MKRISAVLLVITIAMSLLVGCNDKGGEQKYDTKTRQVSLVYFNTVSIISSYGDTTDAEMDAYAAAADELLGYYHHLFDIYFEYAGISNLRTVNKNAGKAPVKVDAELIDFLEECKELFTLTNGKTNVMMGAVLRIWHNYREDGMDDPSAAKLPSAEELTAAAEHTDIDSLIIDREAGTVYISDPEASIDVGAIGKGYATERLYERKWIEYHKWSFKGAVYTKLVGDLVLMARAQFGYLGYYNRNWGYSPFEGFRVGGDGMSGYDTYGSEIVSLRGYENYSLTPQALSSYNSTGNYYAGNAFTSVGVLSVV